MPTSNKPQRDPVTERNHICGKLLQKQNGNSAWAEQNQQNNFLQQRLWSDKAISRLILAFAWRTCHFVDFILLWLIIRFIDLVSGGVGGGCGFYNFVCWYNDYIWHLCNMSSVNGFNEKHLLCIGKCVKFYDIILQKWMLLLVFKFNNRLLCKVFTYKTYSIWNSKPIHLRACHTVTSLASTYG